jgi:hypothetical protein
MMQVVGRQRAHVRSVRQRDELGYRHRGNQRLIAIRLAVGCGSGLIGQIDIYDFGFAAYAFLRQPCGACVPNGAGAAALRKAEGPVGTPGAIVPLIDDMFQRFLQFDGRHAFAHPLNAHFIQGIGPHLLIVGRHEKTRQTVPEMALNPIGKIVAGLDRRARALRQANQAGIQIVFRKIVQIVLQRIGNEAVAHPYPRLPPMPQPLIRAQKLVRGTVEIVVMRKNDMSAHIPCKAFVVKKRGGQTARPRLFFQQQPIGMAQFMQLIGGAKSGRAAAYDEDGRFFHSFSVWSDPDYGRLNRAVPPQTTGKRFLFNPRPAVPRRKHRRG